MPPESLPAAPARLQAHLAGIVEVALDCIVTIDHAGRFLDFNPAAERTFGYLRAQVLGRELTELIVPPAHREHHRAGMARVLAGGAPTMLGRRIEIEAMRADGTVFPVELAITRIETDGPLIFTAHLWDISERKRTEAELLSLQRELEQRVAERTAELGRARRELEASDARRRESQTYFEKSFHSSPALMSIARAADGKLIEVNPAFVAGSGYTRAEALGHSTLELGLWLHPAQRDEFLHRIRADRMIRDLEADFRSRHGQVRTLLLNADVIELGGEPCMLTVGIDITERRRRDQVQNATYEISQAVLGGDDLPALLARVHGIIGRLMPARNFYVALLAADGQQLTFPYFVDEWIEPPQTRPLRNGLTEYILRTGQPVLITAEPLVRLLQTQGPFEPLPHTAAQRLGAPLLLDGRAIGVIAVQDYHNPHAYSEEDQRLLVFVAEQTATAIHRQQVEAAQREARTYFEKSFHLSPALMVISRVSDRIITEANPAFLRACGYTRAEVIGRTADDIGLWLLPAQRDEFLQRIQAHGVVRDLQGEFRTKSGGGTSVIVNADVLELGGERCLLAVGIDITERRRRDLVQAATFQISRAGLAGGDLPALFAEVHRILGTLMPAKNCYVALLNADRSILSFPHFVDESSPWPAPRPPRHGITEYVIETARPLLGTYEEISAKIAAHWDYQRSGQPSAQWLGAPLMLDGRAFGVIAVQDYQNPNAYTPEDQRLLVFVAEQTAAAVQRHAAAAALARAEARYRSIFENAVEGLYVSSPEGKFLSANPALARMLGYDCAPDLLRDINDIQRQFYASATRRDEFIALVHDADEVTNFESEVFRRDGSRLWISESVRVVRHAAGGVDHFEGVATDITQKREAARALQAAKEAADAASRAKSYFLASVSHELRTPLNGILGYTQILRRDGALTDRQRDGIRVIHESADHLLALINDVLDLSKIEAGRIELHPADFDLPDFAAGVERVFIPRAKEKNLLFESAVATDLPRFVRGDEQRLRQIVFNLVANAVKFTAAGGVVFSVQRADGDAVRFSVSDTGPGIAADDVKKLFEPFSQVGHQTGAAATGTGLGLAISRSLVERLGGKLRVESQPGWGSRFWFDVPLPGASRLTLPPATAALPRRVLGYEGPRRRVLVVDDNATNRAVMIDMLAPLGFELAEAVAGAEALTQTAGFKPDLVLMDLRLPGGLDGLEATRRLRQTELGRAAKIVAVSASAYDLDRSECFAAGCDAFLAKPFREEELWSAVEQALGLVWRTAGAEETRTPFPLVVHAPPAADAEALYELAAKGDVVGIRARAAALAARDPRLAPFAQSVLDLAARFKMKAIRQFVARYQSKP
jgi:PAS domain S-box-containing protein